MQLQPSTTLQGGKYKIISVLGQGGFGITYKGYNAEFEEDVAIKEFFMKGVTERDDITLSVKVSNSENRKQFEEQREKFKKEARRLRKLKSSHIVQVFDLFEENDTAYYVMELIEGESLSERMNRQGRPFTDQEVKDMIPQILDALSEVHNKEIWHLDLKPGNLMIDKRDQIHLIDFGASKQLRANGSMTTSTAFCYTPGYAPVEQVAQMHERFGAWTDIYALGATLYNLLTGQKPPTTEDILEEGKEAFSFINFSISNELEELIIWMMQPQRKSRPQSIQQIRDRMNGVTQTSKPVISETIKTNLSSNERPLSKEDESEKTLVIPKVNRQSVFSRPIQQETMPEIEQPRTDCTIIAILKKDQSQTIIARNNNAIHRFIEVGDYVFEDGTYCDVKDLKNNLSKSIIGIVLTTTSNSHGFLLSPTKVDDISSINGKELEWHIANIEEWKTIIENLGHAKVFSSNEGYRFFAEMVCDSLQKYQISETKYISSKKQEEIPFLVDLKTGHIKKAEGNTQDMPSMYITEF